jgi:enamine deaminase RidA (YjgF/YER057c/UK114 family)
MSEHPVRRNISSRSPYEDVVGYSRAVRVGGSVWVAGTTATVEGEVVGVGDPYEQARVAFGIALNAVRTAGLDTADVVRTRMFVTDIAHFGEIGRAHRELFDAVRPVATMVQVSAFAHPDHLVEIEVEAHRAPSGWRARLGA